jgi:hypothetical protein
VFGQHRKKRAARQQQEAVDDWQAQRDAYAELLHTAQVFGGDERERTDARWRRGGVLPGDGRLAGSRSGQARAIMKDVRRACPCRSAASAAGPCDTGSGRARGTMCRELR